MGLGRPTRCLSSGASSSVAVAVRICLGGCCKMRGAGRVLARTVAGWAWETGGGPSATSTMWRPQSDLQRVGAEDVSLCICDIKCYRRVFWGALSAFHGHQLWRLCERRHRGCQWRSGRNTDPKFGPLTMCTARVGLLAARSMAEPAHGLSQSLPARAAFKCGRADACVGE